MSASSPAAWRGTLAGLIAFHIFIIIASNYLVQLPITLFGWHTTWGAFSFPFIFLATDLTVRLLGKGPARLVIARVMIPALIASYVVSVLFQEAAFRGFSALLEFNTFVARISLASFLAYVLGQILDIQVFDRLRRSRHWWTAPVASPILGNLLMVGAVLSATGYAVCVRFISRRYSFLSISAIQALGGTIVFLPFVFTTPMPVNVTMPAIGGLLYMGLGVGFLVYLSFNFALKHLEAGIVALFGNLIPVFTLIFAFTILGERLTLAQTLGVGLTFVGVIIAALPEKQRQ